MSGRVVVMAYRHIPSFRRERGGLYALYVAIFGPTYVAAMRALHRTGRHGRPMANGVCRWCGVRITQASKGIE